MNYTFLYHMKMALVRLKMITRGVHITVSVTSMVLIQMKHECMGIGFIRQRIITQSKGFARKSIEKISRSVMAYVYLVLICQVQTRSTIICNSAPAVDAQQLFKSTFKALINEDLSIDIEKYQGVLELA